MYNPQKPTKWGLHICVITDSTNGYVCGLSSHYGPATTKSLMHPELTFTSKIVLELMRCLDVAKLISNDFILGFFSAE
jgi:hypothetical protein